MADFPAEPRARSSRTFGAFLLLLAFLLGMVGGAALFHAGQRSILGARGFSRSRLAPLDRHAPFERLAREADLAPEQRERVEEILEETREEMRVVVDRSRERMREVLTPEQMEKLDALRPRGRRGGGGDRPRHGRGR
jgi:Spy/CpxP family protein refolding chaperone